MMTRVFAAWLALFLLGGSLGCGSPRMAPPPKSAAMLPAEPSSPGTSDQAILKEGLTGEGNDSHAAMPAALNVIQYGQLRAL